MSNQAETKVDTIVKVVLVFFVCLLSFSVGTYVGKRFSDYQHRIAQLTGETNQENKHERNSLQVSNENVEATALETDTMTSEDVAKLAASLDQAEAETVDLSKSKTNPTQEREIASTPHGNDSKVTEKASAPLSAAAKPSETHATKTKTDSIATQAKEIKDSYVGKFTVQIGSFPTESEAQKVTQELIKKGLSAFYITAKVADKKDESNVKTWYRVNVGLYATAKEAESSKNELISTKSITSGFVQKITE
jgi:cell division septation protein DedD